MLSYFRESISHSFIWGKHKVKHQCLKGWKKTYFHTQSYYLDRIFNLLIFLLFNNSVLPFVCLGLFKILRHDWWTDYRPSEDVPYCWILLLQPSGENSQLDKDVREAFHLNFESFATLNSYDLWVIRVFFCLFLIPFYLSQKKEKLLKELWSKRKRKNNVVALKVALWCNP